MKVTRERFAESRNRILAVAGDSFREKGFDGIGIAEIMKAAGLTHGGFYRHFTSKEELLAQVSQSVLASSAERWEKIAADDPDAALAAFVKHYLSAAHLEHPERGCAFAALGSDAARQPSTVRAAFAGGITSILDVLMRVVPGASRLARRRRSIATLAELVGAMVLARAVDDRRFADEILGAVSRDIRDRRAAE